MSSKKVLFSGRFDICHPGHICQIIRLAKKYGTVKVVILDYPERRFSISYTMMIFKEIFADIKLNVEFIVNKTHFAEITKEEVYMYDCDIYASGNQKVLRHMEVIGVPCIFVEAAYQYSARDIPVKD